MGSQGSALLKICLAPLLLLSFTACLRLITPDETSAPKVGFSAASQTVAEAAGSVILTLELTSAATEPVTVPYTVAGTAGNPSDHDLAAGSFLIPAGQTSLA